VTIEQLVSVSKIKQLANWVWIAVGIAPANGRTPFGNGFKIATYLPG
jgi:hypothetical protein